VFFERPQLPEKFGTCICQFRSLVVQSNTVQN
jgi:hypothetical protein